MYPRAFAPLPDDAPPISISAGFSFYNGADICLSEPLERFLAAGPAPIVFTLGSFVVHAAGNFYGIAALVARRLGRRAVLLVGEHAAVACAPLAGNDVLVLGRAPHAALFPHAACVVHHGGIGTIAQAMVAGLPQLVCPFFGDQFDNASRLRRLGVADSLPLARFDEERAVARVSALLDRTDSGDRAKALAQAVIDDGPSRAANAIMSLIERQGGFPTLRRETACA